MALGVRLKQIDTMKIIKSEGVTETERLLIDLCDQSFLKLWSYPNPYKDDGKELCDLLVIFDSYVFIFFDRENLTLNDEKIDITWGRWKRKVIDSQIRTLHGAERYLRSGRKIYLDSKLEVLFPFQFDPKNSTYHKFAVAHGAKASCLQNSEKNVYGSLGITYAEPPHLETPFVVGIDRKKPVHILDSHNLPILLKELDSIYDFTAYLDAKVNAIKEYEFLTYCGEEDLLANYFLNYDDETDKHFIGIKKGSFNGLMIGEGEWKDFIQLKPYKRKKEADKKSYLWDEIIQRTAQNALDNRMVGNSTPLRGKSAIHEMAREPRVSRRFLSKKIIESIRNFPETKSPVVRNILFIQSFYEDKAYIFLQLKINNFEEDEDKYRKIRSYMLQTACGAAKNKFNHLNTVVGIGIYSPKFTDKNYEDFCVLYCNNWTNKDRTFYEESNKDFGFFQSEDLTMNKVTEKNFPSE